MVDPNEEWEPGVDGYDVAQVCPNGHVATPFFIAQPQFRQDFCQECGAETIYECPNCNEGIRGGYHGVLDFEEFKAPPFCVNCGQPFSWTANALEAARDLTDELDELSAEERAKLKASFDDLVADTPRTDVAVVRVKKSLAKIGKASADSLRKIIVSIGTEYVKKQFGLE